MKAYNPSEVGKKGTIFGYPYSLQEADLIILPVPWEATVSFGEGTSLAPQKILDVSTQIDTAMIDMPNTHEYPIAMAEAVTLPNALDIRQAAKEIIQHLENNLPTTTAFQKKLLEVNRGCEKMVQKVKEKTLYYLNQNKVVGILGGDHSTPLGCIQALSEKYQKWGILQIDAHMDLRKAYQGFTHSHASFIYNCLNTKEIEKIVQVGIRDFSLEEVNRAQQHSDTLITYFDETIQYQKWLGKTVPKIIKKIISDLPQHIYISLDVDGLQPQFCPHTGTPVPGGLDYYEGIYLIREINEQKKKIIGFDISETGCDHFDAIIASKFLFQLGMAVAKSRKEW